MKNRPLTYVGAFLLLIVALVVAIGNFKPETKIKHTTSNPCDSFIKTSQEKAPQEQEKKKYQVSIQFSPIFPDFE
jgi:hypothetical protein